MIPRFKPWLGWPEILALFKSNKGAVERFEKAFAQKFNAVDAIAFPYGRSAQWAFFKALGLQGAEVVMPAYTCSVVAHAVSLSGNAPQFIDINLDDYNMNLDEAEASINENTRAIIATHTFGYPQDLDRLEAMVRRAEEKYGHKVWLIQDCCHAFGAEWNGRMIGTSGDVAVYAFNISKMITSIFGGMLTFQDQALADKVRAWRDANYRPAGWIKGMQRRLYLLTVYIAFKEGFYEKIWMLKEKTNLLNRFTKAYHMDNTIHFPPDYFSKMHDVEAGVGLIQLDKYEKIIRNRINLAKKYKLNNFNINIKAGSTYSHMVLRSKKRDEIIIKNIKNKIEIGKLIEYSIDSMPCYEYLGKKCPNARKSKDEIYNLPTSRYADVIIKEE